LGERREGAVAIPVPVPVLPAGQEVIWYTVEPVLTLNAIRAISQNTSTVKPVLTTTPEQRPTVYNGQADPQYFNIVIFKD
jgi:hypothetical protein